MALHFPDSKVNAYATGLNITVEIKTLEL